jgi:multisubunit Na+/H+ antiporter MnhE subunit
MSARSIGIALATWAVLMALWLLLVDLTNIPELVTGAVCALIATVGSELVRSHGLVRSRPVARGLARAFKPVGRAPVDFGLLCAAIATRRRGRMRAIPFRHGGDDPADTGRRALAEGLGSFAPNTIVLGIDGDRDLIFAHQLVPTGKPASAIDPLELG